MTGVTSYTNPAALFDPTPPFNSRIGNVFFLDSGGSKDMAVSASLGSWEPGINLY